jgi:hypothetical protein
MQDGQSDAVLKSSRSVMGCIGGPLSNMTTLHPLLTVELCQYKLALKRCLVTLRLSEECRSVGEQNVNLHIPDDRNLTTQSRERHISLAVVSDKDIRLNHLKRKFSLESLLHQKEMNFP